jgi:hypothetical protein
VAAIALQTSLWGIAARLLPSRAPVTLLTNIAANGATAFLVILAMTFGLILPRMLLEVRS